MDPRTGQPLPDGVAAAPAPADTGAKGTAAAQASSEDAAAGGHLPRPLAFFAYEREKKAWLLT